MENVYTTKQAAEYLRSYGFKLQAQSLTQYRHLGKGPQFGRLGPAVYYTKEALDQYIADRNEGRRNY